MKLDAYMGGTFCPIHFGHLRAAWEVYSQLDLERVFFTPNGQPYHRKPPVIDAEHRAKMVQLAIAPYPEFALDSSELLRQGPSYTYETMAAHRAQAPEKPIAFIVGMDAFCQISSWHKWEMLPSVCHLIVVSRPGHSPNYCDKIRDFVKTHETHDIGALKQPYGHIFFLEMTAMDISSSAIRDLMQKGVEPRFLVPEAVWGYIRDNRLFPSQLA